MSTLPLGDLRQTLGPVRRKRRWPRIALGTVALLLLVGVVAWRWLTAREEPPATSNYRIDLDELRTLANSVPGAKPSQIDSALVAEAHLPRAAVFAGEPFTPHLMVHQVFQLLRPDGTFLLIDAGFSHEQAKKMDEDTVYHEDAWAAVQQAMPRAEQIVITHEHADHLGGIASADPKALAGRLELTGEQLANTRALEDAQVPQAMRDVLEPLDYDRVKAIAPGVVLQKAAGHTPGSQIIFVQTMGGQEYLFIGDVAWHSDQLRNLHYRPRLVTQFFLHEDRDAVLNEFRALHDLMEANPNLIVVVSHDPEERQRLIGLGLLTNGLS